MVFGNDRQSGTGPTLPLGEAREAKGLSRAQLARASGVRRRRIAAFERGRGTMSEQDLEAVASACEVEPALLVPPGYFLRLAVGADPSDPAGTAPATFDTLLREYLSMVVELRGSSDSLAATIRHEDMQELAKALGGTAELIEDKVMALLATDRAHAARVVRTILPTASDRDGPERGPEGT